MAYRFELDELKKRVERIEKREKLPVEN